MSPYIVPVLQFLGKVFSKENIKSKTTVVGTAVVAGGIGGAELLVPDSEYAAIMQVVSAIVGGLLFLYREKQEKG
jgi:hypothetical protein